MLTKNNRQALALARVMFLLAGVLLAGCTDPGPRALLQGEKLIEQGKYAEAVEKLRSATELLPQSAPAWNYFGLALHHAGQHAEAANAYQQALQRDREFASARYNLGCLLLDYQKPQAAATEFGAYTRLKPDDANGWLKLGAAYFHTRQFDLAEHCLHAAVRINPRLAEALNLFGVIQLERNRPGEAAKLFQAALQQQQNYAPAILNLAILHHHYLDNRPLALQRYRDYLALKPTPPHLEAVQQSAQNLHAQLLAEQRAAETRAQLVQNPPPPSFTEPNHTQILQSQNPAPQVAAVTPPPNPVANQPSREPSPPSTQPPQIPSPGRHPQPAQDATPDLPTDRAPQQLVTTRPRQDQAELNGNFIPEKQPTSELAKTPEFPAPQRNPIVSPQPAEPEFEEEITQPPAFAAQPSPTPTRPSTLPPPRTFNEPDPPRQSARPAATSPDESGFIDRLNPINWVRGRPEPGREITTPLPNPQANAPEPRAEAPATGRQPAPLQPPSNYTTSKLVSRYPYRNPPRPAPGNRASSDRFLAQGFQAHQSRRLATAFEAYQRAAQLDPSSFDAQFNLGLAAYEMRDTRLSLAAYELALAIDPNSRDAHFNFALALQRAHYFQDAADELQKALKIDPNDARAHFTAGNLYAQQLDLIEAARYHYRKVLELDPRHPQAAAIRTWLSRNGF